MNGVNPFAIRESEAPSGHLVLAVEGELDLAVADRMEQALARAGGRSERIVVDLSACEFIDSTGLAVLVRAHTNAEGPDVVVLRPRGQVLRVFELTGLVKDGFLVDDAESALG